MIKFKEMSEFQLKQAYEKFKKEYDEMCKLGINLDISRGKPNGAQLDLSNDIMTCLDKSIIDKYSFDTTCYDSDTIRVTSPNGKAKIKILDFKGYIESVELGAALKSSRGVIKETLINWRN